MCLSPFSVDLTNLAENKNAENISLHLISYLPGWFLSPDSVTESSYQYFMCLLLPCPEQNERSCASSGAMSSGSGVRL